MNKKEILEKTLNMKYTELVPSRALKTDLFILNDYEFEQLRKHMNISDYSIEINDYDTIVICNSIFKKMKRIDKLNNILKDDE